MRILKTLRCYWRWIRVLQYYLQACRESEDPWTEEELQDVLLDGIYEEFRRAIDELVADHL